MRSKKHIGLWIFTLGVLTFLLRPYMVYQLTVKDRTGSGAFGMLQRSVKKKEEHHVYHAEASSFVEHGVSRISPVRKLLVSFFQFLLAFSKPTDRSGIFFSRPVLVLARHRYALTSCLLI